MKFEAPFPRKLAECGFLVGLLVAPLATAGCAAEPRQSGHVAPTPAPAPTFFDFAAGEHNLQLSQSGHTVSCAQAALRRDGGRIIISVAVSPLELQGVVTHYEIYSTDQPVEGRFSGTAGATFAAVGEQALGFIRVAYPEGSKTKFSDCATQGLAVE